MKNTKQKTALVVEGGTFRSVFSSGVLDGFIGRQFNPFDFSIGVSAGAANLAFYIAGKRGKSYQIFIDLINSNKFISCRRFIKGGHLLDLDWLFACYLDNEMLDQGKAFSTSLPLYVCVTDANSGKAEYIIATKNNFKPLVKASMALPLIYRKFPQLDGREMTDGGVADSIPVLQAIQFGATKIIVIRARHESYLKKDTIIHKFIRWKTRNHPALVQTMRQRVQHHSNTIDLIRNPPQDIQIIEVCPPEDFDIGRFSRDTSVYRQVTCAVLK
ncbi:MAG: patatin family protein [Gammaproteobacteria bacterium]|nr:patatin family protein [Gammaproteobacteria bacterium]